MLVIENMHKTKENFFEDIYKTHLKKVQFFAFNYLQDRQQAESIAQDVFLTIWERVEETMYVENIQAYLFVLTKYRCLNLLRKENNRKKFSSNTLTDSKISETALNDSNFNLIYSQDIRQHLVSALDKMPVKIKNTFLLSNSGLLKNREIADKLNVSEKTVEYRMACAYKLLRKVLKDYKITPLFVFFFLKNFLK